MKKAIAGFMLAAISLAASASPGKLYIAKQEIDAPQQVKSIMYGYLVGGCGPYGCERMSMFTNAEGQAEAFYPCQTEGTWVWTDGRASGMTEVPQVQECYSYADPRLPILPTLQLHY